MYMYRYTLDNMHGINTVAVHLLNTKDTKKEAYLEFNLYKGMQNIVYKQLRLFPLVCLLKLEDHLVRIR